MEPYPACYPAALKTRGEMIILAFAKYDNVLVRDPPLSNKACVSFIDKLFLCMSTQAFSAGNEVNHIVQDATVNAPCQKKFIRDLRAFVGNCPSIRKIPIGVVLADPDVTRTTTKAMRSTTTAVRTQTTSTRTPSGMGSTRTSTATIV